MFRPRCAPAEPLLATLGGAARAAIWCASGIPPRPPRGPPDVPLRLARPAVRDAAAPAAALPGLVQVPAESGRWPAADAPEDCGLGASRTHPHAAGARATAEAGNEGAV